MEGVDNDRQIQEGEPGDEGRGEATDLTEAASDAQAPGNDTADGVQDAPAEEAVPTPGMDDETPAEEVAVAEAAEGAEAEEEDEAEEAAEAEAGEEESEAAAATGEVAEEEAAETPEEATEEVAVTAAAEAAPPEPVAPMDPSEVRTGDILRGIVTQVRDDHLLVDVGVDADGVVPLSELTLGPRQTPADGFEAGQQIYVEVLSIDQREGVALLVSERRARSQRAWDDLEAALQDQTIIKAPVVEEVKGGLVVDVGVRAFMPASHVDRGYVSNLAEYVGQNVRAKVVELDRSKNRVILSQRKVLEAEHQVLRAATWAELAEGQIRKGVVKGLTDFGAFIDLGGVDGLLHVSEMAWGRVEHPRDVVEEGEELEIKVLKVDRERERVSLGLKQVLPDPWIGIDERYTEGTIVEGRVERIAPFGAFVQLEPGIEGLVHISQMADHRVRAVEDVVSEGEVIPVKILRIQAADRRISLSLKEARHDLGQLASARREPQDEEPSTTAVEERTEGARPAGKPAAPTPPKPAQPRRSRQQRRRQSSGPQRTHRPQDVPASSDNGGNNVTLGEMFGDLLAETKERLEKEQADQNNQQQEAEAETAATGTEAEEAADLDQTVDDESDDTSVEGS